MEELFVEAVDLDLVNHIDNHNVIYPPAETSDGMVMCQICFNKFANEKDYKAHYLLRHVDSEQVISRNITSVVLDDNPSQEITGHQMVATQEIVSSAAKKSFPFDAVILSVLLIGILVVVLRRK